MLLFTLKPFYEMYIPPKYRIEDAEEVKRFLQQNSFGALVSLVDEKLTATHLPWHLIENEAGDWFLQAHMAKANPQWKTIEENSEVMLMFQGAHTYVTSRWYSEENAPTWNYQAVHVYGKARVTSKSDLEAILTKSLLQYEAAMPNPLYYEHLSDALKENFLKAIVGIEITITDIQAKYKLSQNRTVFDFNHIIQELEKGTDAQAHEVAKEMRRLNRT